MKPGLVLTPTVRLELKTDLSCTRRFFVLVCSSPTTDAVKPESSSTLTAKEALQRGVLRTKMSRATQHTFVDEHRPLHPESSLVPRTLTQKLRHCKHGQVSGVGRIQFRNREFLEFAMQNSVVVRNNAAASVQLTTDELTLFKSSNMQLWLILERLVWLNFVASVIDVSCGRDKLPSAHGYLNVVVPGLKMRMTAEWTFLLDTRLFCIQVDCIICDAPARVFLKLMKSHSG
ncbi:hypothetical protein P879_10156 [Paragonimus westermani]|uniref:Uncharacterized protein n=1 Tax=Paragonimus westermani TaxID=34504 RepID=A0A8T0DDR6_9TREM|nr:hypothetical protein P879_10156 [Paragonimus westermani]